MKFVAWGQPLHTGTHSYIHDGYRKAFERLGYESYHFGENQDVSNMSFKDTIFLTIGSNDRNIPITNEAKYILHNCDMEKYKDIKEENKIVLQVYTNHLEKGTERHEQEELEELDDLTYWSDKERILYQSWATDLFPEEISLEYEQTLNKTAVWCGSIWGGPHGNTDEINKLVSSLKNNGYNFESYNPGSKSFEENRQLVKNNELAPAINGAWQKQVHYIPCRIYKNISYGSIGITNNRAVYDLLKEQVIYSENEEELIDIYLSTSVQKRKEMFEASCNLVKTKHTYINRSNALLKCLGVL